MNKNVIATFFDLFEEDGSSELEIVNKCQLIIENNDYDVATIYEVNEELYGRGYSYRFEVPSEEKEKFNNEYYNDLIHRTYADSVKTQKLIDYLYEYNDHRLTFASIAYLNINQLIILGYLPDDNDYINERKGDNFKELFFMAYATNQEVFDLLVDTLYYFGIEYPHHSSNIFRYDMEFLLFTIEINKKTFLLDQKAYQKVNTIKVALNMIDKKFLEVQEADESKKYYYQDYNKVVSKYLDQIDELWLNIILKKYEKDVFEWADGYVVLLNILRAKNTKK